MYNNEGILMVTAQYNCCCASAGVSLYDAIHSPDSADKQTTTMESRNFDTLTIDLNSCAKDLEVLNID